tara:strand:- start:2648 stop:3121 length:474 start_codon:yes stop_codon:yes gene_type:complete
MWRIIFTTLIIIIKFNNALVINDALLNVPIMEPLDITSYTHLQQKHIKRELANQEQFLDQWCRTPKNRSLDYIVCEGFKVGQEFILSKLSHLEEVENELAYTLTLLPMKTYLSPNNYVLAKTSTLVDPSNLEEDKTMQVAIFKNMYDNTTLDNIELF